MVLSDRTLRSQDTGIVITPMGELNIQPASVDLNLSGPFLFSKATLTPDRIIEDEPEYEELDPINNDGEVIIPSQGFILANTEQEIYLPDDITAFVEGRSSVGRRGLFIQNAGWVDPGFRGHITLELFNASPNPLILTPGIRICQLVFVKMDRPCLNPYCGKYQYQSTTLGSKMYMDIENHDR